MTDYDIYERFTRREELLRAKENALLKALAGCSLDAYRTGYIRPESLAAFDVALAELRSWLDSLSQDIHDEPALDEHALQEE
jgi:hypothetical protein